MKQNKKQRPLNKLDLSLIFTIGTIFALFIIFSFLQFFPTTRAYCSDNPDKCVYEPKEDYYNNPTSYE